VASGDVFEGVWDSLGYFGGFLDRNSPFVAATDVKSWTLGWITRKELLDRVEVAGECDKRNGWCVVKSWQVVAVVGRRCVGGDGGGGGGGGGGEGGGRGCIEPDWCTNLFA
jgi:hypothetical protein